MNLPSVPPWEGSFIVPRELVLQPGDTLKFSLDWNSEGGGYKLQIAVVPHSG